MKRLTIIILSIAALLAAAFVALRVYGAYQQEHDDALERAAVADQKLQQLDGESARISQQSKCNGAWLDYQNAVLSVQIAELEGLRHRARPMEPSCSGHSERMDEIVQTSETAFAVFETQVQLIHLAQCERYYAASHRYQTRYLRSRLWAFLTGTKPKMQPAEMMALAMKTSESELGPCFKKAKNDSDKKTCTERYTKGLGVNKQELEKEKKHEGPS